VSEGGLGEGEGEGGDESREKAKVDKEGKREAP